MVSSGGRNRRETLNPLVFFRKPEYFFRPSQALRRLGRLGRQPPSVATTALPWGARLRVHVKDNVGGDIYHYGVFDRIVPEAIWRLLDVGEVAVDIGANIGQNTSAMAYRTAASGRVLAFEPHPEIFEELRQNRRFWTGAIASIQLEKVALGKVTGRATIADGPEFMTNRGSARMSTDGATGVGRHFTVQVEVLDHYFRLSDTVGVCKIDVEGNEMSVLEGSTALLTRRAIRDVIFEDFNPMPSQAVKLLQGHGFSVFQLEAGWLKPSLQPLTNSPGNSPTFFHNYLGTLDAERALRRFRPPGWRCLMCL